MKRISGYETSDGSRFETRKEAEQYEARHALREWIKRAIGTETDVSRDDLVDNVLEAATVDARHLKALLQPFAPVRRPRKAKDEKVAKAG